VARLRADIAKAGDDPKATKSPNAGEEGGLPPIVEEEGRTIFDPAVVARQAFEILRQSTAPSLVPVVNASGIILHTNLGRAPLGAEVLDAMAEVAAGWSNLEYDLDSGRRGSRFSHMEHAFGQLTGTEAALVVNNNASAVLLTLTALARGKEVIISRGELIEIGGSFRIPDVMAAGGARLREVGTTNRTHLSDYKFAIGPETGLIMKAHRSNFSQEGFTASVSREELVQLGATSKTVVYEDLGSGCLVDLAPYGIMGVDRVQDVLEAGVNLVSFSGDKLLGGPQAGIILGKASLVKKLRDHPLARALRPDKLTLAGLEATLNAYLSRDPWSRVPVLARCSEAASAVRQRAEKVAGALSNSPLVDSVEVKPSVARVGGGAAPGAELPSFAVFVMPLRSAAGLDRALRHSAPPVVARVEDESIILDMRTVTNKDLPALLTAFGCAPPTS